MRTLHRSSRFKTDFKKAGLNAKDQNKLKEILIKLVQGQELDARLKDHPLSGNWKGYRELHFKPDLLLVYKITEEEVQLARLSSHSNIFR